MRQVPLLLTVELYGYNAMHRKTSPSPSPRQCVSRVKRSDLNWILESLKLGK